MAIKQNVVVKDNPVAKKMLKFGPGGGDGGVAEAKAEMIAARETFVSKTGREITPSFKGVQGGSAQASVTPVAVPARELVPTGGDFADEGHPAQAAQQVRPAARPAAKPAAQPAQPAARPVAAVPITVAQPQHFEFDGATVDIYFDEKKRLWTLDITQAPDEYGQSGVERFTAKSRDELLPLLAKAKANATTLIRKQTKAIKVQRTESLESWDAFYATRKLTQKQVEKMDAMSIEVLVDGIQVVQIQQFMNAHPTFLITPESYQPIENFLKKAKAPITKVNMEYALQELGIPVDAPAPAAAVAAEPAAEAVAAEVVPEVAPAAAPAEQPRKRGSYTSGIRPGQSSAVSGGPLEGERQPAIATAAGAGETEIQRAKRLSQTKEGLEQLRREAIPSLANARSR